MCFRIRLLVLFLFATSAGVSAQKYVGLNVDNDLYFGIDRYYTSGIFIEFGGLQKQTSDSLSKIRIISHHWTLGQEINTPAIRVTQQLSQMDYPYNGWLFLGYKKEYYLRPNLGYGWGIQAGTTGANTSLAKFLQNTYHVNVLGLPPLSWSRSIPQAFHLNGNASFFWGETLIGKVKWVNQNQLQAGTFRNSFKSRFGFQFGGLSGLPFFGNRLEIAQNGFSFFMGMQLEYNVHDYSLSGSLWRDTSPFNLVVEKWRNNYQAGIIYFRMPWRTQILLNNTSRYIETQKYKRHPFLKIILTHVF